MKYCKHCKLYVDSSENYCPLCYNYLEELEPETDRFEYYLGRDGGKKRSASNHFLLKLFLYISVCIYVVCFTVNYFTEPHMLWSPVVSVSVLYLWILIGHTILSKRSPFEKIFFQFVGLVVLLIFLERLSMRAWFLDYVLPSILLAASSVMALISLISKRKNALVSTFFVYYVLLEVVSLIVLLVTDVYSVLYLIHAVYNGLLLLGTVIFAYRILKADIAKKAHL